MDPDLTPQLDPDDLERMLPASSAADDERSPGRRGDTTLGTDPEPLRPWSVGEVLDVSLDVFRERFLLLAGTCALLWFPVRLVMPFIAPHTWFDFERTDMVWAGMGMFFLVSFVGLLVTGLCEAVVAQLTLVTLERRGLRLGAALRAAGRRMFAIGVLTVLYQIVVAFGLMCLIVPGVFLAWKFWVAKPALILEQAPLGTAIQRSFELSTGTFWRWLGVALTRFVFAGLLSFTVTMPDDPTWREMLLNEIPVSAVTLDVVNVFLSSIVIGTVTALSAVVVTVFYVDCRVRRDGLDLDLELDRIEQARPVPAPAGSTSAPAVQGGPA